MKPVALRHRSAKFVPLTKNHLVQATVVPLLVNIAIRMGLSKTSFIEDALTVRVSKSFFLLPKNFQVPSCMYQYLSP